jgi:predicted peptidase
MKYKISTLGIVIFFLFSFSAEAQTMEDYKKAQFIHENDTLNYRILFPKDFSEENKYPVVLVLHGAGERGNNNEAQLTHGGKLFLEKQEEFPAIVIFPQAPLEDYWAKVEVDREVTPFEFKFKNNEAPTQALDMVMKLMDSISSEKYVDQNRIYVGGLSMGGMGTYELLSRKPEMFAAAFAICGGADPAIVENYRKGFNIWIFHGEQDDVVLPKYSKIMAREINSMGSNAKLSLYAEDNHNSWDTAFAEPHFLPWLFNNIKENKK